MEACFDRHDARSRWIRRVDAARPDADQFLVDRFLVPRDFRARIDRGNGPDVWTSRPAFRVHLWKAHSSSSKPANAGRCLQYLLWYLVRVQLGRRRESLLSRFTQRRKESKDAN